MEKRDPARRPGLLRRALPRRLRVRVHTGLRWKLSAAIAAVGALVALALSLVVHNAARVSMLDGSRDVQDERVRFAQRIYESTGRLNYDARIDDPELPDELREAVLRGQRATYLDDTGDDAPEVWAAVPLANGKVLSIHTRFTDRYAVLNDLNRALSLGSVVVVGGGCLLGVLVGGGLSRRLRRAATAARKVARGDTEVRVQDAIGSRVRDETDELARAVDAMADALQQRLEAERRVTADIAHELRTPVTGLLTAAELLPPGRPTELVRDRAQALRTLVEDVLEVARLDSATERAELQEIALGEFVTRRVRVLAPEAEVVVARDANIETDPRRLERILGNLLANAAKHGGEPVEVTVDSRVLRVRDHGPGFPPELLAAGPDRFRTGSPDRSGRGHGLGLTIAAGQARVLGARLTFRNAPAPFPDEDTPAVQKAPGGPGAAASGPARSPGTGASAAVTPGSGSTGPDTTDSGSTGPAPAEPAAGGPARQSPGPAGTTGSGPAGAAGSTDSGAAGTTGSTGSGPVGSTGSTASTRSGPTGSTGPSGPTASGPASPGATATEATAAGAGKPGAGKAEAGKPEAGKPEAGPTRASGAAAAGGPGPNGPAGGGEAAGTGKARGTDPEAAARNGGARSNGGAVAVLWLPQTAPTETGGIPAVTLPG